VMFIFIGPMMKQGGYVAGFGGVPLAALGGLFLTIIWRTTIANLVATPIGNLYDGGSAPAEAKAFYSNAIAQRKRGNYQEALALVRKQLEKFPTDFEGQLLMADIQAENLNDLPGAAISIERICNQPGHPPRNVALALNILADWYLKLNQDRDAARETLQKIIDRLPDSEMSVLASQRIASLATTEHLLAAHDRKKFAVVEGVQNIGLLDPKFHPKPSDADAAKQAEELVAHLRSHPLDTEAREKLAVIYADHYNRLDLATDQFEQLITHPNQPSKKVVHWLNKLADVQIRHGVKHDLVRETVQRIIDLYPNTAAAELAASRIALLKLELKGKAQGQAVKLGSYEQDIGLKMKGGG
jgi:TolA-binding protein